MTKAITIQSDASATITTAWTQLKTQLGTMQQNIVEAGKTVAYLLDHDPQARDKFRTMGITPGVYNRLEKVGRGTLLPELAEQSHLARLPIDQQRQIVSGTVTALVEKPDGTFDTMPVDIMRADPVTVYRVIASDHIRTPAEQRAMIESQRKRASVPVSAVGAADMPWRVVGKTVIFKRDCAMGRSDLLSALRALEG